MQDPLSVVVRPLSVQFQTTTPLKKLDWLLPDFFHIQPPVLLGFCMGKSELATVQP